MQLTSVDLPLAVAKAAGQDGVTHEYQLFAGPKRDDVLPEGAAKVVDFGMFHWISRPDAGVLKAFHSAVRQWGVAVICLTIIVRTHCFRCRSSRPAGQAKMQELQPEIAALKEKYGKDKEKSRGQMELFRKHKLQPAGRLPARVLAVADLHGAVPGAEQCRRSADGELFVHRESGCARCPVRCPVVLPFLGWNRVQPAPVDHDRAVRS